MNTQETANSPRIYVASLADYNAGRLHGCWIDASEPYEDICEQVTKMLAESSEPIAEEWAIHDYENFGTLRLSEYEDLERVAVVARLIVEHGPVFAELVSHFGGAQYADDAAQCMEEGYRGAFDSLADFTQETIEDCYAAELNNLPDFIRYHIDYEGIAHDMDLSGDVLTISCGGKVHVFDSNL